MNFVKWVLIGVMAFEALVAVGTTGRERKPRTAGDAVAALIEWGLLIWLVVIA